MASYAIAATVTDPVTAIADMSLAIERVIVTMDNANSELMEQVVGRLNDPALPRVRSACWLPARASPAHPLFA